MYVTDDDIIRRTRREIDRATICEPAEGETIGECVFSRTGWAVVNKRGLCTCSPTNQPVARMIHVGRNLGGDRKIVL